ncbi:hypothetical protein DCO58_01710 [Helicobacter saguini]|uniref:Uncharacterized protein n=1 Tax=Helicobacter saguini TaxID=1548018 RepID=A0A347VRH2_9HELI|nr:hypothetical protein [Helicobacter saguini]MWV62902.1 hypothetical protein [Helicobacter saguini]MWV66428.1 hypothetical protein [Helicobacter saguini]MWV68778.1 hypothetical protein [Helicobacter saguini]MWV71667.1 hypothetical protein [Helicobacter saguini]TLD94469.1 hypothetical protein LS64_005955 [Helicobacter saguini]
MFILGLIHLLCACVVVGYLVYDVLIFRYFKLKRSESEFKALKREVLKPSVVILGVAFLGLLLSGFGLFSFYVEDGFLEFFKSGFYGILDSVRNSKSLSFESILVLKLLTISLLFIFTPISFFYILVLKKPDPMRRFYHHLALLICLIAVILARFLAH